MLSFSFAVAKDKSSNEDFLRNAYRQILATVDKNKDGKMSMAECMSNATDKNYSKQNCLSWDADRDGTITEDEYIKYFVAKH